VPTGKTPKKGGKGFGKLFGKGAGTAGKGATGSLGGLGTAAASVAVIAAAVVAASAMIYTGVKAMNKAEDGFKEASNTAKDLSSAASTAKTELEGLSNSFDTLKDKKDALKGLTEGTLEYKMAL
jgi:uncharacterized phage infection (PIP) family protein YhgE